MDSIIIQDFEHAMPFDADFFSQFQNDSIKFETSVKKFSLSTDSTRLEVKGDLHSAGF